MKIIAILWSVTVAAAALMFLNYTLQEQAAENTWYRQQASVRAVEQVQEQKLEQIQAAERQEEEQQRQAEVQRQAETEKERAKEAAEWAKDDAGDFSALDKIIYGK